MKKDDLYAALVALKNPKEAEAFLKDLCSEGETGEMAARLKAAQLLDQGQTYTAVTEATGLSSTTIARVSLCLKRKGSGYALLLKRLKS